MKKHVLKDWLMAVRPWSFPASAMPVAVTLAYLYWMQQDVNWTNGVWALLNIIVFHAAGNTWSDYFDYKHHVDREDTHGVRTLTGGLFRPQEIFRLSLSLLVVALIAGVGLMLRTGLPLLYIGIGGAACTLLYPALKYRALGDVVIFVAYALLPMLGTAYVATGTMDWSTMWAGVPVGLITVAILHANNTRDIETDVRADIRTLAMTAGGIWPAIVGTFYLMVGSALFAFPVGVMSGIYMNEYAPKRGWVVRFIRMMTNNLSGIPSIVFGLFGMALFVNWLDFGDSILAGSLTLGLLSLPLVIRTTEEALKAIPDSMREGSRALGATKLQTIWHVILPMGMPNIITGLILALGRVSGETAPILFTCAAYFLPRLPQSIFDQCMALPYHLYVISTSGTDIDAQLPIAYGTALVLIVIILFVNLLANALRKYFEKKVKSN